MPVALAAIRILAQRRQQAVRGELDLDRARREPVRAGERSDGAVGEAQDGGRRVGDVARPFGIAVANRHRADHVGFADQVASEVVQVGRLLDHLAAALPNPRPPGRWRRAAEPAGHDHPRRPLRQPIAELGHEVQRAEVVADRHDQAGPFDGGGQPGRPGGVVGRQRLLGQERDPPLDQALADRDRPMWRNAHVDGVRTCRLEHPVEVVEWRPAPGIGHGRGTLDRARDDADELRPSEPLERLEVQSGDPAGADQPQPDGQRSPPKILDSSNGAVSSSWS